MAARRTLYEVKGDRFRSLIRSSLVGMLGDVEPRIASRVAQETEAWMRQLIVDAVAQSRLKDKQLTSQLLAGLRLYGSTNLSSFRATLYAYPWVFPHEYGAEIKPSNGRKYLALPVYYALRSDGTPKFRNPSSWKRWGSFVYRSKTDKLFLAYKSADGELRLLYLLEESVSIPARLRLNLMANERFGALYAAWGAIYIDETTKAGRIANDMWKDT